MFTGLAIKIGGATSFDIYPYGWDKTFPMDSNNEKSDMAQYNDLYFIGDKCRLGGNDYELYEYVKNINESNAFETKNTDQTIQFINQIIKR